MMGRLDYALVAEPTGSVYRDLVREAARICESVSLIQRRECDVGQDVGRILDLLSPMLTSERDVSEWPGTRLLFGGTAILREYALNERVVEVLVTSVEGLYQWQHPSRLEDPVFWRSVGNPWLVTVAHESDAVIVGTPSEMDALRERLPELAVRVRPPS